jgi:hypothetical protein
VKLTSVTFNKKKLGIDIAFQEAQKFQKLINDDFAKNGRLVHEVSVNDYIKQTKSFNHRLVGYRTGVNFSITGEQEIDPYLLGIWLGDGSSNAPTITNVDKEIIDYFYSEAKRMGLEVNLASKKNINCISHRIKSGAEGVNTFLNFLKTNKLICNKHIPDSYKIASRDSRLKLLAGLIDTDGYFANGSYYEITQKNDRLADDIVFLARSLGFYVSHVKTAKSCTNKGETYFVTEKNGEDRLYNRINICGDRLGDIPVLIERKKAPSFTHVQNPMHYKITVTQNDTVEEYFGFEVSGANHRVVMADFTVTHNSTLRDNLVYYNRRHYPVAKIFNGTEDAKKDCGKIFPLLYISPEYREEEHKNFIARQRTVKNLGHKHTGCVMIIDDCTDDPKVFKTKTMRGQFKLGSRHWDNLLIVGTHAAMDFPPDIRKSTSFVAIFKTPDPAERKKIYQNFGGICGTYNKFCELLDQLTGDYTCMIIDKRTQSNNIEDCVFYYRTKQIKSWKFGAGEYRSWSDKRCDAVKAETEIGGS